MYPPAWHPDPLERHEYRYWDGERWTEHVADAGQATTDPVPGVTDVPAETAATDEADGRGAADAGEPGPATGPAASGTPAHTGAPASDPGRALPRASQVDVTTTTATNGAAVAAMVVGLLSLLVSWVPVFGLLGLIGGLVAVILGFVGRKRARQGAPSGGMALSGIITGFVAIAVAILVTVLVFAFRGIFMEAAEEYDACMEEIDDPEECEERVQRNLLERMMG